MLLRILTFVLILAIGVYALSLYLRLTGMFFPDRYPVGRWDTGQWMVEPSEHWFTTPDQVRLHGWLFRAEHADAPVMIWFHGNAGNLTDRAEMAAEFARRGLSVFLFDYRGFGRSEGRANEWGAFRDSLAAYDYVKDLGARRLVLYGESIGGPYAAHVARKRRDGVSAVILENSFPSLKDLGNALYHPLPLGWSAPLAMRTTDWLNEAGVPVLVMHGKRDAIIPYRLGVELYDGLRVPKEFLSSEAAGHCEIPLFDAARYYETVQQFTARNTPTLAR